MQLLAVKDARYRNKVKIKKWKEALDKNKKVIN